MKKLLSVITLVLTFVGLPNSVKAQKLLVIDDASNEQSQLNVQHPLTLIESNPLRNFQIVERYNPPYRPPYRPPYNPPYRPPVRYDNQQIYRQQEQRRYNNQQIYRQQEQRRYDNQQIYRQQDQRRYNTQQFYKRQDRIRDQRRQDQRRQEEQQRNEQFRPHYEFRW